MLDFDDNKLLDYVKAGNHQAFGVIVSRHGRTCYGIVYRYVGNRDIAEDIVQQAFLKLWECPDKYDSSKKFTSWFFRVAVNLAIDFLRKNKIRTVGIDGFEVVDDSEDMRAGNAELEDKRRKLEAAIASIPKRQRIALNLSFYDDLPYSEVAEIMGIKIKAVQSLVARAKDNIKKYMGGGKV